MYVITVPGGDGRRRPLGYPRPDTYREIEHASRRIGELTARAAALGIRPPAYEIDLLANAATPRSPTTPPAAARRREERGTRQPGEEPMQYNEAPAQGRGPHGIRLQFSSHEEFLSELRERGPNLEPVVRVTLRHSPDASGAPFLHLTVLATYLRRIDEVGPVPVVAVAQLAEYVGTILPGLPDEESRETRARADELRATVARVAGALGHATAAGAYAAGGG